MNKNKISLVCTPMLLATLIVSNQARADQVISVETASFEVIKDLSTACHCPICTGALIQNVTMDTLQK